MGNMEDWNYGIETSRLFAVGSWQLLLTDWELWTED
jgi:hypothetical protein